MTSVALVAAAPAHVARATIAKHSKSFALASRLLDPRTRDQTAVVYTWCRRADDAIDEVGNRGPSPVFVAVEETRPQLLSPRPHLLSPGPQLLSPVAMLRRELDDAYEANRGPSPVFEARPRFLPPIDPVLAAFGAVARDRGIPRIYPDELLAGMAMDVADTRYATMDDLRLYCWRVAGVVGLMMTHVFGVADDDALVHAAHLGIGMQLTNISRDVAEDWERGRLYVPDELLAQHGAAGLAGDLGHPLPTSARAPLGKAVRELLAIADRHYRSGDRGLRALPWRAALAVKAASNVYRAIGARIARANYDITAGRAVVSTTGKLARVASAALHVAIFRTARRTRVPTRTLEISDVPQPG